MIYSINDKAVQGEIHFNSKWEADRLVLKTKPVGEFYQELYAEDRSSHGLKVLRRWQAERILKKIRPCLPSSQQSLFLDVGCGSGLFPSFLREKGLQAFGIDPALPYENQFLKKGDLSVLGNSSGDAFPHRFSCVTLLDVFEHFEDPGQLLQQIKDILEPDGLLILKVPNKSSLLYRLVRTMVKLRIAPGIAKKAIERLFQLNFPPPHYYFYNLPSLKKVLEDNGWDVVDSYYISESPLSCLWQRLWGLPVLSKLFLFAGLSVYEVFTSSTQKDGLTVHAVPRQKS